MLGKAVQAFALILFLAGCGSGPELAGDGPLLTATVERQWAPDQSPARQAAFSRDGRLLAASNASGRVILRDTSDWHVVADLVHPGGATAVAFAANGRRLYSGGYDGQLRVWDIAARREIGRLAGAQGTVWAIDVSPDGTRLAAAGEDRIIRIWPLDHRAAPLRLIGHERIVWEVRFSPDGARLASGGFDATARIWDARTGAALRTLRGHSEAVVGVDFSPDGRLIATAGDDSTIRLWRAGDGAPLRVIDNGLHANKIAFSPDGRWLASGGHARGALGTLWHQLTGGGGAAAPVHLWRVADGAPVAALAHDDDVPFVAFSPDGRRLVTSAEDGATRLWVLEAPPEG
jgi:WD40 repeat protein